MKKKGRLKQKKHLVSLCGIRMFCLPNKYKLLRSAALGLHLRLTLVGPVSLKGRGAKCSAPAARVKNTQRRRQTV